MSRKIFLILEDNDERIEAFRKCVATRFQTHRLMIWRDAHSFIKESEPYFSECCLISLDHDLVPISENADDPGDGVMVAKFLAKFEPFCPVIIHTTNVERRWSMHNELRFEKWNIEIVGPIGDDWIEKSWLSKVQNLIPIS